MEQLVFVLILIGMIFLIMFFQYLNAKKSDKLYLQNLQKSFGNNDRSSYDSKRLKNAQGYYQRHRQYGQLDDITWSDLGLDEFFSLIDTTQTDIGREVLYYRIRTILFTKEEIDNRRSQIEFWRKNPELRGNILLYFHHMRRFSKASIFDYLDALSKRKDLDLKRYIFQIVLTIISIALIWPLRGIGVIIFICVTIINLITYYKAFSEIKADSILFDYILDLINVSEDVARIYPSDEIINDLNKLHQIKHSYGFERFFLGGSNPIGLILDILGSLFFAKLFRYQRISKVIQSNIDAIDSLIYVVGGIDADISMAGYIEYLGENCCKYEIAEAGLHNYECTDIYHPLLASPVSNSVTISSSILLTGANASGKSTFLKTIALAQVCAQSFGYVCAKSYSSPISLCVSSMSIKDDISKGDSYYMAEIKNIKRIIDAIPAAEEKKIHVICFVDELLRGTNTIERIAASSQILNYLNNAGVTLCAATHDLELCTILQPFENYHFDESIKDGDVYFSYKLEKGPAESRNAIRLLENLGFSNDIVDAANDGVAFFENNGIWKVLES